MQHYSPPAQDVESFLKESMFRFPFFVKSKFTPLCPVEQSTATFLYIEYLLQVYCVIISYYR